MCKHVHFDARVEVSRLHDIGRYAADVHVWCADCNTPFMFLGLPNGLDLDQPTVSIDATEARLPIHPVDETRKPLVGVKGYTVTFTKADES